MWKKIFTCIILSHLRLINYKNFLQPQQCINFTYILNHLRLINYKNFLQTWWINFTCILKTFETKNYLWQGIFQLSVTCNSNMPQGAFSLKFAKKCPFYLKCLKNGSYFAIFCIYCHTILPYFYNNALYEMLLAYYPGFSLGLAWWGDFFKIFCREQ